MRRQLNENPVVQMVLIGVLVVIVGYMFMTRIAGGGSSEEAEPATTDPAASAATAPSAAATAPAATAPTDGALAPAVDASTGAPATAPAVPGEDPGAVTAPAGAAFEAGPGLPEDVVKAYEAGKTVVLLVVHDKGIDDRKVTASVVSLRGSQNTALFVVSARDIADYSRIAEGVDVDRVPAIIVIQPENLSQGGLPEATVVYGYRGPESIAQAVRDANYKGPDDLPYYPK